MAMEPGPYDLKPLKSLIHSIETATNDRIAAHAQFHAQYLKQAGQLLKDGGDPRSTDEVPAEVSLTVNKFKVELTNLLNNTDPERRVAAIILIKAAIESAGVKALQDAIPSWVKGLFFALKKTRDYAPKTACLVTLARILHLCSKNVDLNREVVTKGLLDIIKTCVISPTLPHRQPKTTTGHAAADEFTDTVIQSLILLGPKHPTLLRPYVAPIQAFLKPWVVSHGLDALQGGIPKPREVCENARQLSIIVLACAPRTAIGQAWTTAVEELLLSFHRHADIIFRSLDEVWEPEGPIARSRPGHFSQNSANLAPHDPEPGPFNLPSWSGIEAGVDRMLVLMSFIQVFLGTRTVVQVHIPYLDFYDALDRVLLASPRQTDPKTGVSKYERDIVELSLIAMHVSAFRIHYRLTSIFGTDDHPMIATVLNRVVRNWKGTGHISNIRAVIYMLVVKCISLAGRTFSDEDIRVLSPVFSACCKDITSYRAINNHASVLNSNPNAGLGGINEITPPVCSAASRLLRAISKHLQPQQFRSVDFQARTLLARTAFLSHDEEAMLSTAIARPGRPGSIHVSILPLLARSAPKSSAVEALIRPQMPTILQSIETETEDPFSTAAAGPVLNRSRLFTNAARQDGQKRSFFDAFGQGGNETEELMTPLRATESTSPPVDIPEVPVTKKAKSNKAVTTKKVYSKKKAYSSEDEDDESVDVLSGVEIPNEGGLAATLKAKDQRERTHKVGEQSGITRAEKGKQVEIRVHDVDAEVDDDSDEEIPLLEIGSSTEDEVEDDDEGDSDFQDED